MGGFHTGLGVTYVRLAAELQCSPDQRDEVRPRRT
jgi:hypothetical protein